jgi:hypothetical protein
MARITYQLRFEDGEYFGPLDRNGNPNGIGVMMFDSGRWYTGQWTNGLRGPYGELYSATAGTIYKGAFYRNARHGQGVLTCADGSKYEGSWANDMQHGDGFYADAHGNKTGGRWENSAFVGTEDAQGG